VAAEVAGVSPIVYVDTRSKLPKWAVKIIRRAAQTFPDSVIVAVPNGEHLSGQIPEARVMSYRDLGSVNAQLEDFGSRYVHLSTAPETYERACFERFLILSAIMNDLRLDRVWHLDTDALPLRALVDIERSSAIQDPEFWALVSYRSIPSSLGDAVSAGNALLTRTAVEEFVDLVQNRFYAEDMVELAAFFSARLIQGLTGGVCDMTAWGSLAQMRAGRGMVNSNVREVGGALNINSLYQLRDQLERSGFATDEGSVWLRSSQGNTRVCVGTTSLPAGIIHFSGADKEVSRLILAGHDLKVDGYLHKGLRFSFRVMRRASSLLMRADSPGHH
jgi:hypothetical protein